MNDENPSEEDFDISDLDKKSLESIPVDKKLDHAALVEQGKRVATLENLVERLEKQIDMQHQEMLRLRKLMRVWVDG